MRNFRILNVSTVVIRQMCGNMSHRLVTWNKGWNEAMGLVDDDAICEWLVESDGIPNINYNDNNNIRT